MTNAQKLALRASEIRTRLSELAGVEEITEEQRSEIVELRVEYGEVETRAQAAIIADDEPKPTETSTEARELAELIEGSSIGAIFASTLEHPPNRRADGRAPNRVGLERQSNPVGASARSRRRAPRDRRNTGANECRRDARRDHPGCFSGLGRGFHWR